LRPRTAVVTGAAGGIGFALSARLARGGAEVVMTNPSLAQVKQALTA
jgi:NAD(P)-dependent dehydrogenase (short-subunit alcohol dehydrogenase family)